MRTCLLSLSLLVALSACTREQPAANAAKPATAAAVTPATTPAATPAAPTVATYGKVTEGPTVSPTEVLAKIDEYDGKPVRVEGTVKVVCEKRGCWMDVAAPTGETIRVKVQDGEVVFPQTAVGKKVIAEGTVVKIPADPATDPASCGGGGEGHTEGEGHEDCARPSGAAARLDGVGATIIDAS